MCYFLTKNYEYSVILILKLILILYSSIIVIVRHTCQHDVRKLWDMLFKKWDFIDQSGTKTFLDIKLTEHYYCVECALLYSTVACLALLKSSSGVCKLKQLELQLNLQDRRAHT